MSSLFDRETRPEGVRSRDGSLDHLLHWIRAAREGAGQRAEELTSAAKAATRVHRFWMRLDDFASRDLPLHVLRELDENEGSASPILEPTESPISLSALRDEMSARAEAQRRAFPALLEEACTRLSLPLDRSVSRHPRYYFRNSFLQLEILDKQGRARISDVEGRLLELPCDVAAVAQAIQAEDKRLFGRPFDAKRFLRKLLAEYRAILKTEKLQMGGSAPLRKTAARFGRNRKGFRIDEFVVDLSKLLESGMTSVEGFALDLQQTKDTDQGLLLHGAAGRGYVGFLCFRKEAQ